MSEGYFGTGGAGGTGWPWCMQCQSYHAENSHIVIPSFEPTKLMPHRLEIAAQITSVLAQKHHLTKELMATALKYADDLIALERETRK